MVSEIEELTPEMFKADHCGASAIEKSPRMVMSNSASFLNTTVDESASNDDSPFKIGRSASISPTKMLEGSDNEECDQEAEDLDVSLSSLGLDFV